MNGTRTLQAAARASAVFSSAREGITSAHLEFPRGAARLSIGGAEIPELFRARFGPPVPRVAVDGETVTVAYSRISPRSWVGPWGSRRGWVTLSSEVAWALSIRGVAHLDAGLRDLIEGIDLARGASQVAIQLPRPSGVVPVGEAGGVSHVTLRYPAGTAARLRVGRGVACLGFEEQEFGAVGGAAHVRIAAEEPQERSES